MLKLKDIRKWIADFGIAEDSHVYIGKLDNKKQESIGVYSRSASGSPEIALGGLECTSYETRHLSLLIHWNRKKSESEDAAFELWERIRSTSRLTIENMPVSYIRLMVPEPQDVGTDDSGVYEYVIWLDLIYSRKEKESEEKVCQQE